MSGKALSQVLQALQGEYQSALLDLHAERDAEALHRLRVALRRARSLLSPMRRWPAVAPLYQTLGEAARHSGALRDLEVLLQELSRKNVPAPPALLSAFSEARAHLLKAEALYQVSPALAAWQETKRRQRVPQKRIIKRHLLKQQEKWQAALLRKTQTPHPDRHVIRLLVKRLRYTVDTYPKANSRLSTRAKLLKKTQALLGDWHDREMWEAACTPWPELQPMQADWAAEREMLAQKADKKIRALTTLM